MSNKSAVILGLSIILAASILAFSIRLAVSASEVGRYQFEPTNGVNVFVLDTKTGRIWQKYIESSGGPSGWSENEVPWGKQ